MSASNIKVKISVRIHLWFKLFIKAIASLYNLGVISPDRCIRIIQQASQKTWCVYRVNKGAWRKLDVTVGISNA
jgi:hypothetical protein